MFVSLGVLLTKTETGVTVELTNDDGARGSLNVEDAHLPCPGAAHHTEVVLIGAEEKKVTAKPRRRKQASVKQEKGIAQSLGGQRHYGSGNKTGYEGDVRVEGMYRIEAKYTGSKSYRVTRAELEKVRSECSFGEQPLFYIDFKNPETLRTEDSWVLVPRSEWEKHAPSINK